MRTMGFLVGLTLLVGVGLWFFMIRMPGESYSGPFPTLSEDESALSDQLRMHVRKLADGIGERNLLHYDDLLAARDYAQEAFARAGYEVRLQEFEVVPGGGTLEPNRTPQTRTCHNLEVEIPGSGHREEIVIIGAHYDSAEGTPGANDNGSGTAAVLALARLFAGRQTDRTLRFVLFTNEEPPYFQTPAMGSLVYAKRCEARQEKVVAMLSLETIGYYSDAPGSQQYPFPIGLFYPTTGNFLAFIGDTSSRELVRSAIHGFRKKAEFPSEGVATFGDLEGIDWSDHWSFWQAGYPGVMVTDSAPFRYEQYHKADDTPEKLNYDRLARVVTGLDGMIMRLVDDSSPIGSGDGD